MRNWWITLLLFLALSVFGKCSYAGAENVMLIKYGVKRVWCFSSYPIAECETSSH